MFSCSQVSAFRFRQCNHGTDGFDVWRRHVQHVHECQAFSEIHPLRVSPHPVLPLPWARYQIDDELENALQDALGGDEDADEEQEEEQGDDQDLGDALAEALAAAGDENAPDGDEESEEE